MKRHEITGGGSCRLHAVEAGNPRGPAILFIHGFSQCSLAWNRQLRSDLTQEHRLVAMDMRGHGSSDKPRDAYGDSRLWADDVNATIEDHERPVGPAAEDRLVELQILDGSVHVVGPKPGVAVRVARLVG